MKSSQITKGSILVTGASSGIGMATALELAGMGFLVFAGVLNPQEEKNLRGAGGNQPSIMPVVLDITSAESIAAARKYIEQHAGSNPLVGIVNNAGIAITGPLEYLSLDRLRLQLETNLVGHVAVTQAFLPLIRKSEGRVVNIGSMGSRLPDAFLAPYIMSKHALKAFNDSLRIELRPWRIRVSLVEPGCINTPLIGNSRNNLRKLLEDLPPEGRANYGKALEGFISLLGSINGTEAKKVAGKIVHALTSSSPRCYYPIGMDYFLRKVLYTLLPTNAFDALYVKMMSKPSA